MENDTSTTQGDYDVQLNVRISPKLDTALKKVARQRYTTASALVREGILGVIRENNAVQSDAPTYEPEPQHAQG
jgi:hypothetical protein|tara:strand:+ start:164 stop:385 length:222 start_codon:yes stop_codon:yes gene_type:complete